MRSNSHFEQFVAREQRRGQSAYERAVLDRWMQLLAARYHIYNVNNAHRCFDAEDATHRPAHVVRPFASVPQFYGCVQCGRSHHCWGERDSCELIYSSEQERVEVCRYSGRVCKNQDNLRATFEDTNRRRPSLHNYVAASYCPKGRSAGEEPRRPDKATRKKQRLIRSLGVKRHKKSKNTHAHRDNSNALLHTQLEEYDLSLESVTSSSSAEEESDSAVGMCVEEDETASSSLESEAEENAAKTHDDQGEKTLKRKRDATSSEDESESASSSQEQASDEQEDDERDQADGEDLHGECDGGAAGFVKNYHNNLQYNNERYGFMAAVARKWGRERDESHEVFVRELRESRRAEEVAVERRAGEQQVADEPDRQFALQEQTRNKIYAECELLLRELLQAQRALHHLGACQQFYAPLLCNIGALVYASEKLAALTRTRTHKNQKQQKNTSQLLKLGLATIDCGGLDALQSDAEFHEYTLDPRRLCRVLLHYLLLQPLSLRDTMGNRVDLWRRDVWLAQATALLPRVEHDRRELQPACELVRECLTSYARCPYWTRAMIFWPEAT